MCSPPSPPPLAVLSSPPDLRLVPQSTSRHRPTRAKLTFPLTTTTVPVLRSPPLLSNPCSFYAEHLLLPLLRLQTRLRFPIDCCPLHFGGQLLNLPTLSLPERSPQTRLRVVVGMGRAVAAGLVHPARPRAPRLPPPPLKPTRGPDLHHSPITPSSLSLPRPLSTWRRRRLPLRGALAHLLLPHLRLCRRPIPLYLLPPLRHTARRADVRQHRGAEELLAHSPLLRPHPPPVGRPSEQWRAFRRGDALARQAGVGE